MLTSPKDSHVEKVRCPFAIVLQYSVDLNNSFLELGSPNF